MGVPVAMRLTLALLLCSASAFARLGPRDVIVNSTTTTAVTSPTPTTSCGDACTVTVPTFFQWSWVQITPTTTITAATIIYLVNTNGNFTRTLTSYNEIPEGYTTPGMNRDGTVTCDITLTRDGSRTVTSLAYPTVFRDYQETYKWVGTLSTDSTCALATNGAATVTFSSHPDLNTFSPTPTNSFQSSVVASVASKSAADAASFAADPKGSTYACAEMGIADYYNVFDFLFSAFPSESAFQSCDIVGASPETAVQSAVFVTDTTTSTEGPLSTDTGSGSSGPPSTPVCHLTDTTCSHTIAPAEQTEHTRSSGFPSQTIVQPTHSSSGGLGLVSMSGFILPPPVSNTAPQADQMTPDLGKIIASIANNGGGSSIASIVHNGGGSSINTIANTGGGSSITISLNPTSAITLPPSVIPAPGSTAVLGSGASTTVLSATTNSAGQTVVVVAGPSATQTITLAASPPNEASSSGLGSIILSGINNQPSSTGTGVQVESTAGAAEKWIGRELWSIVVVVVVMAAA